MNRQAIRADSRVLLAIHRETRESVVLKVSVARICELVGMDRVHVASALSRLESEGYIRHPAVDRVNITLKGVEESRKVASLGEECEDDSPLIYIGSHKADVEWENRLVNMLKPLVREVSVSIWRESDIGPGSVREDEFVRALKLAKVIVFLISPDFLAAEEIHEYQLAPVSRSSLGVKAKIVPVYLRPFVRKGNPLCAYQPAHDVDVVLSELDSPAQERTLAEIAQCIIDTALGNLS